MREPYANPKLGVGLAYQPAMRGFIEDNADRLDYLEVVPDMLWTDRGVGASPRYIDDPQGVDLLRGFSAERPVIPHSIGLSIGAAHRFNREHIRQLRAWHDWLRFPWHSDHLAYNLAEHGAVEINAGVTIPLPRDEETLEALAPRIAEVQAGVPVPFALENNVYFFDFDDCDYDDAGFLNTLCERTGCRLLLDLHNVYVNYRNHGVDARELLDRINPDHVIELHIAGGFEHDGYYLDSHSGPTPEPVWDLLDRALENCRCVGGVTFELLGSWFADMGPDRLIAELSRMRDVWARHQPAPRALDEVCVP